MRNCKQTKCGFYKMGVGCRKCQECGAEPYIIDENCHKCWNCENDAGILRWDDDVPEETEKAGDTAEQGEESEMILIGVKR
jgi:hypothetical protein